ncbi:MAG: recombinase family protein, partial [Clostridia bacterium]|nr:recombinase family protein [Clostridia bacterium]
MIRANENDAITYTRVSSDEQRQKGYSIDYQQKETQEYCKNKNFNIIRRFSESYTAKKPGRPA